MNSWAGDGAYWWSKNPKVTNFYYVTYAAADAKDPDAAVRAFEDQDEGGRLAWRRDRRLHHRRRRDRRDRLLLIKRERRLHGRAPVLAATLSHLTNFKTLGGPISFTPTFHSPTGRSLGFPRVIEVNNNVAKVVGEHTTQKIPNIH